MREANLTQTHHSSLLQTGSRQELRELVRAQLQALLKQKNFEGAKALLVPVKPVDIAEAIEGLPESMQAIAFRLLSKDEAIEVFEYLDPSVQQALIERFKHQDVLDIVDKMSPDDRARLFDELPAKVVRHLIEQLSPIEREATTKEAQKAYIVGETVATHDLYLTTVYPTEKKKAYVSKKALPRK